MSEIFCGTIEISNGNVIELSGNTSDIRLFKIKLPTYYHLIPKLINYLNDAELQRSQKYHFEKDANRFIICRALLKFILAQHLGFEISAIHIEIDKHKKPYLSSHESVSFNVSHSGDYGIIALSKTAIGIDVEYIDKNFDFKEILPTVYSSQEINKVLTSNNKTEAFYKFWTRKEAIVKATGKGINDNLPQIPAMDGSHIVPSLILESIQDLTVLSFDLDKDYATTLAYCGGNLNVEEVFIYELPTSMEALKLFIRL